jgi:hypothetical protein
MMKFLESKLLECFSAIFSKTWIIWGKVSLPYWTIPSHISSTHSPHPETTLPDSKHNLGTQCHKVMHIIFLLAFSLSQSVTL